MHPPLSHSMLKASILLKKSNLHHKIFTVEHCFDLHNIFFPKFLQSSFQEIKEDSMGDSNPDRDAYSDKDFDDIPDSYEGLQMNYDREAFESSDSSRQADAGSSSTMVRVP